MVAFAHFGTVPWETQIPSLGLDLGLVDSHVEMGGAMKF